MSEELKPCPLCGGESRHYMSMHKHNVGCTKCAVKVKGFATKAEAITTWTTRPSPWIKITPTTMPETDEFVWVRNENDTDSYRYDNKEKAWFTRSNALVIKHYYTHWMSVPEIPNV